MRISERNCVGMFNLMYRTTCLASIREQQVFGIFFLETPELGQGFDTDKSSIDVRILLQFSKEGHILRVHPPRGSMTIVYSKLLRLMMLQTHTTEDVVALGVTTRTHHLAVNTAADK